ncbi:chemotaxis protein CheW [Altererythrobacter sp. HHU K3-1]|uniref:Chemotaxis protein CheW n=2 Tax=Qipengyuania atrilutea TaxID=2744473 RepID=A0A850H2N7_9SPHN|nr:chemotaxis protein CheW [Actirhodobacter atriluteus]
MDETLVLLTLAGRRAALPASAVGSVIEIETIVPVPKAAPHIAGLTAMRSQALTVVDCRAALGLGSHQSKPGDRAVVVTVGGHQYALLVDGVDDVEAALSEPRAIAGGFGKGWDEAAIGMVETSGEPALLVDPGQLVNAKFEAAA